MILKRGMRFKHALMSHRGGGHEHVENTLPGFRYSGNVLKTDLLELDCHLTKDKIAVVIHDSSLKRLCGVDDRVENFDYDSLPKLLIPPSLQSVADVVDDKDSYRIPKLEELLAEFPAYPMQIDLKQGPEELVGIVGGLIKKYNREQSTLWGSLGNSIISAACHRFDPSIPLFFHLWATLTCWIMWRLGLWWAYKRYFSIPYSCVILPDLKWLLAPNWFKELNALGISVIVFNSRGPGLNSVEAYERIKKTGANGICTDRPTLMTKWLETNSMTAVDFNKIQ